MGRLSKLWVWHDNWRLLQKPNWLLHRVEVLKCDEAFEALDPARAAAAAADGDGQVGPQGGATDGPPLSEGEGKPLNPGRGLSGGGGEPLRANFVLDRWLSTLTARSSLQAQIPADTLRAIQVRPCHRSHAALPPLPCRLATVRMRPLYGSQ